MDNHTLFIETELYADILTQWKIFGLFLIIAALGTVGFSLRCMRLRKKICRPNSKKERTNMDKLKHWESFLVLDYFLLLLLCVHHVVTICPKYTDMREASFASVFILETEQKASEMTGTFWLNPSITVLTSDDESIELKLPYGKEAEEYTDLIPCTLVYGEHSKLILCCVPEEYDGKRP